MDTYLLTGNPGKGKKRPEGTTPGMKVDEYEESYRQACVGDFADDYWTMQHHGSAAGDQVVLLRQDRDKPGLIAFGQRRPGEHKKGDGVRREEPVRFYNIRSIRDDPFISAYDLRIAGFGRSGNFRGSGTRLRPGEQSALEQCCLDRLNISLSVLCSVPHSVITLSGIDAQVNDADDAN
jgi:hypothetical protein